MTERLLLRIENRFDVPPAYALAWLTDFRPEDMRAAQGEKAPMIQVTRLPDGRIQREFAMMGMAIVTRTTIEPPNRWIATMEARDKKGRIVSTGRVVETVEPDGTGTRHVAEIHDEKSTLLFGLMMRLSLPMQRRDLEKLFAHNKREMEAAHAAGKPPTS